MISVKEREETLKYLYEKRDKITDYSTYCDALNMTHDQIINYVPQNKLRKKRYNKEEWLLYKKKVRLLTSENIKDIKTNKPLVSNKDHFYSSEHYVYDHKISVYSGFKNNVPIELMASLDNLRFVSGLENSTKGMRNYIDDKNKHIFDTYFV
jgi:hypothetical protein